MGHVHHAELGSGETTVTNIAATSVWASVDNLMAIVHRVNKGFGVISVTKHVVQTVRGIVFS